MGRKYMILGSQSSKMKSGNMRRSISPVNHRFPKEKVKRGQLIALADSTGSSTGHHCHFEVISTVKGVVEYENPRVYLQPNK